MEASELTSSLVHGEGGKMLSIHLVLILGPDSASRTLSPGVCAKELPAADGWVH